MIVDHLPLTHIIKSKVELAIARIKRLLEPVSFYSINIYYIKGKDIILSDFLSRENHDDSNLHELIPISFNMHDLLHAKYYNVGKSERYLVQTQSQMKSSGVKLPEVHGMIKSLDPNIQLEKQNIKPLKGNKISQERPWRGQGRAGMRRWPSPITQTITQTSEWSKKIPEASKLELRITNQTHSTAPVQSLTNSNDEVTHRSPMSKDIPFYPNPTYRPPPKPTRTLYARTFTTFRKYKY